MTNSYQNRLRVSDPVLTNILHGYGQGESVANFVAPPVSVGTRSGYVIKFDRNHFATLDTRRSPGSNIQRVNPEYNSMKYTVEQHALASSVRFEDAEEAASGEASFNLRVQSLNYTAELLSQSWENDVMTAICDTSQYETSLTGVISNKWISDTSDPEADVEAAKEAIRRECGVYPNAALISPDVYNALKRHPALRDRIKYTSDASINTSLLASLLDLPQGIRVAERLQLDESTNTLVDMFHDKVLLFRRPTLLGGGFVPQPQANRAIPSFAYTYVLSGYPIVEPEYEDKDTREYISSVIYEQSIQLTGLGSTGKVGGGYLMTGVTS